MFILMMDNEWIADGKTLDEMIAIVATHKAEFDADKAQYPDMYEPDEEFYFDEYEIYQKADVDFRKVLTTHKRGTMPKSWRAEGENFID